MFEPAAFLSIISACLIAAFISIVVYQLLIGKISTTGLLTSSVTGQVDPERLQLLIGSFAGAAYYAAISLQQISNQSVQTISLPDVPDFVLALLVGSQSLYLGGKLTRQITGNASGPTDNN